MYSMRCENDSLRCEMIHCDVKLYNINIGVLYSNKIVYIWIVWEFFAILINLFVGHEVHVRIVLTL